MTTTPSPELDHHAQVVRDEHIDVIKVLIERVAYWHGQLNSQYSEVRSTAARHFLPIAAAELAAYLERNPLT